MSQFTRTYLRPAGDALLLLVALSVANLLIGNTDPGWLHVNPAPFLAVPVFIGARYGFSAGVIAGGLTGVTILAGRQWLLSEPPAVAWENFTVTLAAFPVIGALSGELRRLYAARMRSLETANRKSRSDKARLQSEVDLLREANRSIRQDAAFHGAELAAIDLELRDILSAGNAGIFGNTLDFLRRATGVEEAVLAFQNGSDWRIAASSIHGDDLTEIDPLGREMASRACNESQLVTWAALWETDAQAPTLRRSGETPEKDLEHPCTWLAAVPWNDAGSGTTRAVLLVRTMPLHRVTWDNFARISTICRWVAGLAVARISDTGALAEAKPLPVTTFKNILGLAATTGTDHHLPSALLALKNRSGVPDKTVQDELVANLRPTDVFAHTARGAAADHAVLLPLSGQRDAAELLARLEHSTGQVISVDGTVPAKDLWRDLADGKLVPQRKEARDEKPGTQITPRAEPV